jgi:hypothetical protein
MRTWVAKAAVNRLEIQTENLPDITAALNLAPDDFEAVA